MPGQLMCANRFPLNESSRLPATVIARVFHGKIRDARRREAYRTGFGGFALELRQVTAAREPERIAVELD